MLLSIFFGLVVTLLIYIVVRALFAEYNGSNIWLHYAYAVVLFIIGGILLFVKYFFNKIYFSSVFWSTILISIFVIAIITLIFIIHKDVTMKKK